MKNNKQTLVTKLKELESTLKSILKQNKIKPMDKLSETEFKDDMNKYIQNIAEAKKVLQEYEKVANELKVLTNKELEESEETIKAVIKLRAEPKVLNKDENKIQTKNVASNDDIDESKKYLNEDKLDKENSFEYEIIDGKPILVKPKNKSKKAKNNEF